MNVFIPKDNKYIGPTSLKVYNKEGKVKMTVDTTEHVKIIRLYKYDKEVKHIHSYTIQMTPPARRRLVSGKGGKYVEAELLLGCAEMVRNKFATYYDYTKVIDNVVLETLRISDFRIEHWEVVGDMEEISTETSVTSGNVYETRKKKIEDQLYMTTFENGKMTGFNFSIPENKINEYLDKLN